MSSNYLIFSLGAWVDLASFRYDPETKKTSDFCYSKCKIKCFKDQLKLIEKEVRLSKPKAILFERNTGFVSCEHMQDLVENAIKPNSVPSLYYVWISQQLLRKYSNASFKSGGDKTYMHAMMCYFVNEIIAK